MTILQMQYFKAVCIHGSVTRAAEDLFVSRPAISRLLSELEKELGVTLFWRSSNGLALTEEGKVFYENCCDILNRIEALEKRMFEICHSKDEYIIRVGLTPATGIIIFPQFYRSFYEAHPDIKLKVVEYGNERARQLLSEGEIDAMFTSDLSWDSKLCGYQYLFDTELVFCVSKEHHLARKDHVTLEDIKNEPLIYMEKNMQREKEIAELFASHGLVPQIIMRTAQISLIKRIVTDGSACAVQIKEAIDDGEEIIGIPFRPKIPIKIGIKWNLSAEKNKKFKIFLEYVKQYDFKKMIN